MEAALWGEEKYLRDFRMIAILDPLAWHSLSDQLDKCETESLVLFCGPVNSEYAEVLPHCAIIEPLSALTGWIAEYLYEKGAIFVHYKISIDKSLADIVAWLSRINYVTMPGGESVWFRWYDPIILDDFLPISTVEQNSFIFGELIERIVIFNPQNHEWKSFYNQKIVLTSHVLNITQQQVRYLENNRMERLVHEAVTMLHNEQSFSSAAISAEQARKSIIFAEKHGISNFEALQRFIYLDALSAWSLCNEVTIEDILNSVDKNDKEKIQEIEAYLNHESTDNNISSSSNI